MPFLRSSWQLCCSFVLLLTPWSAQAETTFAKQSFDCDGRRIRMDFYAPPPSVPRKFPILVLHGAGGMLFDGPDIRRVASVLADAGHPAYVIHYFERTGTVVARDAVLRKNFETWLPVVRTAIGWVQAQQPSAAPRVGIYGYSLGAFLAVTAASDDPRVVALAEQSGGIWNNIAVRVGKMPPTLMLHGRQDQRVPFTQYAEPLFAVLRQRGAKVETRFFANEAHRFSPAGQAEARAVVVAFFARY